MVQVFAIFLYYNKAVGWAALAPWPKKRRQGHALQQDTEAVIQCGPFHPSETIFFGGGGDASSCIVH